MKKPKFEVGDILRTGEGPSSLMRVESVSAAIMEDHRLKEATQFFRYYGTHIFGGLVGHYEEALQLASEEDCLKYEHQRPDKSRL